MSSNGYTIGAGPGGSHTHAAQRSLEIAGVDVWSAARVLGALYGGMGLFAGCLMVAFGLMAGASHNPSQLAFTLAMPFVYGAAGALGGGVTALLYNLVAASVGGLEIELR